MTGGLVAPSVIFFILGSLPPRIRKSDRKGAVNFVTTFKKDFVVVKKIPILLGCFEYCPEYF